jgi:hypothetical protein
MIVEAGKDRWDAVIDATRRIVSQSPARLTPANK